MQLPSKFIALQVVDLMKYKYGYVKNASGIYICVIENLKLKKGMIMFNAIKFFLILMMVAIAPLSVANSCMESCRNVAYQYLDQNSDADSSNVVHLCSLNCTTGNSSCFFGLSEAELAQSFKGKPANYASELCKSLNKEKRDIRAQKRAVDKENLKARLREYDRKHEERMQALLSQQNQTTAQARTQTSQNSYPSSNSSNGQSRSSSSGKVWNVDEATHCLQVISANPYRGCGRPGDYEFKVKNSCSETIKYTLQLWGIDGRFAQQNAVYTIGPNSTGTVSGCDLNGQYGKYMSACFERNWLKTCSPLNRSDYDDNGNLITQ